MKNIITLLLISTNLFSQIVVHSKNDPRLLAYKDSLKCYMQGIRELRVAKGIKDRQDTMQCRIAYAYVNKFYIQLNQNIKSISQLTNYMFAYKITDHYDYIVIHRWFPEVWKKPECKVIYEPISTDTIKKVTHNYVYTINGKNVSKEDFEKIYGRKTKIEN